MTQTNNVVSFKAQECSFTDFLSRPNPRMKSVSTVYPIDSDISLYKYKYRCLDMTIVENEVVVEERMK